MRPSLFCRVDGEKTEQMIRNINSKLVLLVLLSGCQVSNPSISTPTLSFLYSDHPLTQTILPTPTVIATPAFEDAVPPTWTSLPTFPADEGSTAFLEIFQATEECKFPCLGGIIPGETSWEQTLHYLFPYSQVTSPNQYLNAACPNLGECNVLTLGYLEQGEALDSEFVVALPENTVKQIWFRVFKDPLPDGLTLAGILNTYGPPNMVLMDTNPYNTFEPGYTEGATIILLLSYPEYDFIIVYYREADMANNVYTNCEAGDEVQLFIFDPSIDLSTIESINSISERYSLYVSGWRPIAEVTGLTQESFFDLFRGTNPPCIISPVKNWQR